MENFVLSYDEFMIVQETEQLSQLASVDVHRELLQALVETNQLDPMMLALYECSGGDMTLFEGELNEETLAQRFKERAEKAKELFKDKGKDALTATQQVLLKIGDSITKLVQQVVSILQAFLKKAWEHIKEEVAKKYEAKTEEIKKSIKKIAEKDETLFKKEVGQLKTMASAGAQWVSSGFAGAASSALNKATSMQMATSESLNQMVEILFVGTLVEAVRAGYLTMDALLEDEHSKIPFLSKLAHHVASVPPFSLLHHIEHWAGEKANNGLHKASLILNKVAGAGGPFEFVLMGSIFSLITGYAIKHGVTELVSEIAENPLAKAALYALPFLGVVLTIMKYVAKAVWLVGIAETVVDAVGSGEKEDASHAH